MDRENRKVCEEPFTWGLLYEKNEAREAEEKPNYRNGFGQKTIKTNEGSLSINVPRDRHSEFEPMLVPKRQSIISGLDEQVIALFARGMTTRDIQEQLLEIYRTEISHSLISQITDLVQEDVKEWQTRRLNSIYCFLYMDCLIVSVRDKGRVMNKALYMALRVNLGGRKELLGMWLSENEGPKFWLSVLTELKNRGIDDVFIACVDGLTGFPEAIEAVYPQADVQLCMVHLQCSSTKLVSWKDRKELCGDLRIMYKAVTGEETELQLELFAEQWDKKYLGVSKSWRAHWKNIIPMFQYPPEIRRVIYTTNPIESMNMSLRKVTRNRRIFLNDESVFKIMYLAIQRISKKWTMPISDWKPVLNWFYIHFEDRLANSKSFTHFNLQTQL
jgi:putative transposase